MAGGGANLELLDVDGDLGGRVRFDGLAEVVDLVGSERDAGHAEGGRVAEEDLGEGLGDDGLETILVQRLWGVLAGGAAAKVYAGKEDVGTVEALFVEWVVGPLPGGGVEADIVESKLT